MSEPLFDFELFLRIPRLEALTLSPDGSRLVATVAQVGPDAKSFTTSLWALDAGGDQAPCRLTRSVKGESNAAFLPDGSLLFTSKRHDAEDEPDGEDGQDVASLWLLADDGGEARRVAAAPGGIQTVAVARTAGCVVYASSSFPGTTSSDADEARAKARKDAGVSAQLFENYPIRFWDHYLGPRERRLFVGLPPSGDGPLTEVRDLTPEPGPDLEEVDFDVSPDGTAVVTGWRRVDDLRRPFIDLVAIDVATGGRRNLLSADANHTAVRCSPDGHFAVCVRQSNGTPDRAIEATLWLVALDGTEQRDLTSQLDLWPQSPVWAPDSSGVWFVADQEGHRPVFRADLDTGAVTRLTNDGSFSDLCPSPDGRRLFALMSTPASPPQAVVIDIGDRLVKGAGTTTPTLTVLPMPGLPIAGPGRVEELVVRADDGVAVHSWLVLPSGASTAKPAPLAVFIHGGPHGSWAGWQWRWNPHLLAARGYAVLLPDPALSTGYGQAFIERGWGQWGARPFTDVLVAVDAAVARADIDETRTAALGGSFGGYMANWVASHTDRFRAIVTHASLWALDQFHGTTDVGTWVGEPVRRSLPGRDPVSRELAAPLRGRHRHAHAGNPRRTRLPRPGQRIAALMDRPEPPRR